MEPERRNDTIGRGYRDALTITAGFPSISQLLEQGGRELIRRARPEAYLDPTMRAATSPWHQLAPETVNRALDHLRHDLATGSCDERYGPLRRRRELDVGLRLVCADVRQRA